MRRNTPALVFVLVTLAIDSLGIGIVIPVVPSLVRELTGLSPSNAVLWQGAVVATYSGAQFLAGPILGGLSDRFGRRPVLLISVGGLGLSYLLLAAAPTIAWVYVARLLAGATAANVSAVNAYIADITSPANRAKRFGLVGAVWGAAFVLGPAVGGLLGGVSLRLPFLVAAGLSTCNFLYGLLVLPESLPASRRRRFDWRRANVLGSWRTLTATADRKRLAGAWACSWVGMGTLQATFVLYTQQRYGWGTEQNGLALGLVGLSQIVVQLVVVRQAIARLGERRAVMTANLTSAVAYGLFAAAAHPAVIYAAIVVQALGAVAGPGVQSLVSRAAGADQQGEMQGALSSVQGLTAVVAPIVAALLFNHFAASVPGAAFIMAGVVYVLSAWLVRGLSIPAVAPEPVGQGA
ncbi:MAG TPA: MFS transporter [Acidisphaera sp.]|nr:MFS transporter [Acidisphaera sp.]